MAADRIDVNGRHPLRTFLIVWAGQLTSSLGNGMIAFARRMLIGLVAAAGISMGSLGSGGAVPHAKEAVQS